MVWNHLSKSVRKVSGNTKECGKISPVPLVSGLIWIHPYVTYHNNFIESEWWALKEIWNKKLLYKGFKIVPYCPRCGTPLSAQEVAQGYKDVKERSAIVRFQGERRRCLYSGMDHNSVDSAIQHGTLCKSG